MDEHGRRPAHDIASRGRVLAMLAILGGLPALGGCEERAAADPAASDALRGQRLMAQYQCGSCHTIPGVASARGKVAVTLEAFGLRSYIAGRVPNTPEHLADWIRAPASLVPQTTMPAMGVSAEDAKDMAAYLGGLQ